MTHRNPTPRWTVLLVFSLLALPLPAQQGPEAMLQAARHKQMVEGELQQAVALYQKVIESQQAPRAVVARALLEMGECYEKLGRAEAQKTYQRVLSDYADQREMAADARRRLAALNGESAPGPKAGITARRIWTGSEVDVMGAPSPDERLLSFVDWQTGDLAVRDLVAGQNRRITKKGTWRDSSEYAEFSVPSPDGRQVAYAWFNGTTYDLRVIGIDGSNMRVVHQSDQTAYVQPSAWFPDGKSLVAIISGADLTNKIVLFSVADGSARVLKSLDWRYPGQLRVSPGGRYLAYDFPPSEEQLQRDVFILASDGTREAVAVQHPSNDLVLGWSPDGGRLIFASDRTGKLDAWALRVAGGKGQGDPELIKHDLGDVIRMRMTPRGSFFYGMGGGRRDIFLAGFDPDTVQIAGEPRNIAERYLGANFGVEWSNDGTRLAYLSRRSEPNLITPSRTIVLRDMRTGAERELRTTLRLRHNPNFTPVWSPDDRYLLLFARDQKNRAGLYRIDVADGAVAALVSFDALSGPTPGAWLSKDQIVFARRGDGRAGDQITVRDLNSGEERVLHRASHIHTWAVSPDRRTLAVATTRANPGEDPRCPPASGARCTSHILVLVPVQGGEERELARLPEAEEFTAVRWLPDARGLLFSKEHDFEGGTPVEERGKVWYIAAAGGQPRLTSISLGVREVAGLRFHPGGKQVAYPVFERSPGEVWVLENFVPPLRAAAK